MRVLQLEADAGAARAMTRLFEGRAVTVHVCSTVAQAGQTLALCAYDVVLANLRLPDGSSAELCRALRARGDQTPVVVLAEAMTEAELVGAYAAGASLCLRKPIAGQELIAHVEAITRSVSPRQIPVAGAVLHVLQSRLVLPDGNAHTLSVHECRLCLELARHPGTVITREALGRAIWGDADVSGNDLDVLVFRIRKKLGAFASLLQTERGRGYRLLVDSPAKESGIHPLMNPLPAARASGRRAS